MVINTTIRNNFMLNVTQTCCQICAATHRYCRSGDVWSAKLAKDMWDDFPRTLLVDDHTMSCDILCFLCTVENWYRDTSQYSAIELSLNRFYTEEKDWVHHKVQQCPLKTSLQVPVCGCQGGWNGICFAESSHNHHVYGCHVQVQLNPMKKVYGPCVLRSEGKCLWGSSVNKCSWINLGFW